MRSQKLHEQEHATFERHGTARAARQRGRVPRDDERTARIAAEGAQRAERDVAARVCREQPRRHPKPRLLVLRVRHRRRRSRMSQPELEQCTIRFCFEQRHTTRINESKKKKKKTIDQPTPILRRYRSCCLADRQPNVANNSLHLANDPPLRN
jgi:hypothetical protein